MWGVKVFEKDRTQKFKEREMIQEWFSWEHLIREDVRRLNYRFLKAQEAMMRFNNAKEVEKFALEKLKQIILEECRKERKKMEGLA